MIMGNNNFNNGNIFNKIPDVKIKTEGVSSKLNTQSYVSVEEIRENRQRLNRNINDMRNVQNNMNENVPSSSNKPVNHIDAVRNLRNIGKGF